MARKKGGKGGGNYATAAQDRTRGDRRRAASGAAALPNTQGPANRGDQPARRARNSSRSGLKFGGGAGGTQAHSGAMQMHRGPDAATTESQSIRDGKRYREQRQSSPDNRSKVARATSACAVAETAAHRASADNGHDVRPGSAEGLNPAQLDRGTSNVMNTAGSSAAMQQPEAEPAASPGDAIDQPHHTGLRSNTPMRGRRGADNPYSKLKCAKSQSCAAARVGAELKPVAAGRLMWHVLSGASTSTVGQANRSIDQQLLPMRAKEVLPAPKQNPGLPSSPKSVRSSEAATATAARVPGVDLAAHAGHLELPATELAPDTAVTAAPSTAPVGQTDSLANRVQAGADCAKEVSAEAAADVDGLLEDAMAAFRAGAADGIIGNGAEPTVSKVALSSPQGQPRSPGNSNAIGSPAAPMVEHEVPESEPADVRTAQQRDGGLGELLAELTAKHAQCVAQAQHAEADCKSQADRGRLVDIAPGGSAASRTALRRMQAGLRNMERVLSDLRAGIAAMPSDDVLYARPAATAKPKTPTKDVAAAEVVCLDEASDQVCHHLSVLHRCCILRMHVCTSGH